MRAASGKARVISVSAAVFVVIPNLPIIAELRLELMAVFLLTHPSEARIARFLQAARAGSFSYSQVGMTKEGAAPAGFDCDHNRFRLGSGASVYERAIRAVRRWQMFAIPGAQLCWPSATIEAGTTVAIAFHHFAFWSLNAARIVYTLDEQGEVHRFGFAYGTLADHAECGEERFLVEWDRSDDSVYYDLFAFSHPQHPLVTMTKPLARRLQKNFVRQSQQAMLRAVV
jgi:uncharacterized protein (UPF0548 family)